MSGYRGFLTCRHRLEDHAMTITDRAIANGEMEAGSRKIMFTIKGGKRNLLRLR